MKQVCSYVIGAGGTGGHINAALSIGQSLSELGHTIQYLSGKRPLDYKLFHNYECVHLTSSGIKGKSLSSIFDSLLGVFVSFFVCVKFFLNNRPSGVILTGGYVCGPIGLAAFFLGIPIYILEQNSVAGLSNILLAPFAEKIFSNFKSVKGLRLFKNKMIISGNPIRNYEEIKGLKQEKKNGTLKILAIGGSLGANDICKLISMIASESKVEFDLEMKLQTGINNVEKWEKYFSENKIGNATLFPYLEDMVNEYHWANLIVSRSGASSLSELEVLKKPCILLPFPFASDDHQRINAKLFFEDNEFPILLVDKLPEKCPDNIFQFMTNVYNGLESDQTFDHAQGQNPLEVIKREIICS